MGAINSYYASRIAAPRQSLSGAQLVMAIRAIKKEQSLAVRAIIEKWQGYFQNRKQKSGAEPPKSAQPTLRYSGLRKG
jgi:hypothetical protein